ncbi:MULTISPECIES: C40 family peptidase [unclassified Flavobacterium]|uniref:C40 family peptidase n=1 Tax=unclassified Flavobacterium TaxID=196869 RepID=UPI000F0CCE96|nr:MULTISPECIES: C40 family peptidase [unclassified Flavobacterium]AYN05417.1 NlpC/P60 family protein [Flavobacterium sp. 140616W15]MCD0473431.1 C40 family peptidase [Flavobacterium sp. EDS]
MKKLLSILALLLLFASCKSTSSVTTTKKEDNSKAIVKDLIYTASENIGVSYKAGGTTNKGYDCSGLVFTTFNSENIKLPRTSLEQSKIGEVINRNKAKKGDLIFFRTNRSSQINHVGLIVEISSDEIKFIHSSTSKGVIISSTKEPYYRDSYAQVNRILE